MIAADVRAVNQLAFQASIHTNYSLLELVLSSFLKSILQNKRMIKVLMVFFELNPFVKHVHVLCDNVLVFKVEFTLQMILNICQLDGD
jgi:hypothetical protein